MPLLDDLKNKRERLTLRLKEIEAMRPATAEDSNAVARAISGKKAGLAELDAAIKSLSQPSTPSK